MPRSVLSPRPAPAPRSSVQKVMPLGRSCAAAPVAACAATGERGASKLTPARTAPPARPAVLRNVLRRLFMIASKIHVRKTHAAGEGAHLLGRQHPLIPKNGRQWVGARRGLGLLRGARAGACRRPHALARTRLGAGGEADAGAFECGGKPLIEAVDIGKVLHLAGIIDDRREVGDVDRNLLLQGNLPAASDIALHVVCRPALVVREQDL